MKNVFKLSLVLGFCVVTLGCGGKFHGAKSGAGLNDINQGDESGLGGGITDGVARVTAYIPVDLDNNGLFKVSATISNPVTIVNPAHVTFTLDGAGILNPPITNALLNFGKLAIGSLSDNNLRQCGTDGRAKCTRAYIQMYTTGVAGAGLWNAVGGYGMPIYTNLTGSPRLTIGLNQANAAVVQQITIPTPRNVLRLSDFTVTPSYEMRADMTEAGAGSYSTTLVVEYGLLD